jgi:hypothetical protein
MRQVIEAVIGTITLAAYGGIFAYALVTPDPMQVEIGRRAAADAREDDALRRRSCIHDRTRHLVDPTPDQVERASVDCP